MVLIDGIVVNFADGLTLVSVVMSFWALMVSKRTAAQQHRVSTRPVLVFSRREADAWIVENVGNGPALDVVIADMDKAQHWHPLDYFPIAAGSKIELRTVRFGQALAAVYSDVDGNEHTSTCISSKTVVSKGNEFPKWQVEGSETNPNAVATKEAAERIHAQLTRGLDLSRRPPSASNDGHE